ncbi:hypothetical protein BKA83DRAFT_1311936 [Pisolithus microcarpus]|nr:hypothetical protein BKA83DRAFT_1311936 [Pisolithus microcarpus]
MEEPSFPLLTRQYPLARQRKWSPYTMNSKAGRRFLTDVIVHIHALIICPFCVDCPAHQSISLRYRVLESMPQDRIFHHTWHSSSFSFASLSSRQLVATKPNMSTQLMPATDEPVTFGSNQRVHPYPTDSPINSNYCLPPKWRTTYRTASALRLVLRHPIRAHVYTSVRVLSVPDSILSVFVLSEPATKYTFCSSLRVGIPQGCSTRIVPTMSRGVRIHGDASCIYQLQQSRE